MRPVCRGSRKTNRGAFRSTHRGIWFFRNKMCWTTAIVSLAAINSDIECCSFRWMIVGMVDIAVKGEGRRVSHVLIVNLNFLATADIHLRLERTTLGRVFRWSGEATSAKPRICGQCSWRESISRTNCATCYTTVLFKCAPLNWHTHPLQVLFPPPAPSLPLSFYAYTSNPFQKKNTRFSKLTASYSCIH